MRKLAAEKSAKVTDRSDGAQMSISEPPELVAVGEPKKPARNRNTSSDAIFGASVHASCSNTKMSKVA
jgi:hypothetical protein